MSNFKNLFGIFFLGLALTILNGCAGFNQTDARKFPPNPEARVKKNLEEGRGFRLDSAIKGNKKGGIFFCKCQWTLESFLDTIDFMPLSSVNYSGGIIITDWYTDEENIDESVKISIRFLTNEVRADALDIKVFYKKCNQVASCKISQKTGSLVAELKKEILTKATIYKKEKKDKNFKEYNTEIFKDWFEKFLRY